MRKISYSVANWSDLPPELLGEIAIKLIEIADFTAFRGVCSSWRAATAEDMFKAPKLPLLMLSDNHYRHWKFYSLSTKKIRKAAVPEAEGKICMDAGFRWIFAVAPKGNAGEVCLFKPFSSSPTIPLPEFPPGYQIHKFPYIPLLDIDGIVRKAILTADPSKTSDFMVLVLFNCNLVLWKNGDDSWTTIESERRFVSIGYCGHKMYAVDNVNHLWSWNPSATATHNLTKLLTLDFLSAFQNTPYMKEYMTESTAGELLVITRNWHREDTDLKFKVFQVDVARGEWVVKNGGMGKDAIFCSRHNAVVFVASDDFAGLIKPNAIYYRRGTKYYMKILNFEDKSSIQMLADTDESYRSIWIFP